MIDDKSKAMRKALDGISETIFGTNRSAVLDDLTCVFCKGPAMEFKDDLSRKEYKISGMCQGCQDEVFE